MHFTSAKLQESAGLIGKEAPHVYTVSKDGALHAWTYRKPDAAEEAAAAVEREAEEAAAGRKRRRADGEEEEEGAGGEDEGGSGSGSEEEEGGSGSGSEEEEGGSSSSGEEEASSEEEEQQQEGQRRQQQAAATPPAAPEQSRTFAGGHWKLTEKHYFMQRGAKLSAADFQVGAMAVVAVAVQPACSREVACGHSAAAGLGSLRCVLVHPPVSALTHTCSSSPRLFPAAGCRGPAGCGLQQRHLRAAAAARPHHRAHAVHWQVG